MISDFCVDLGALHGTLVQRLAALRAAGFSAVVARAESLAGELSGPGWPLHSGLRLAALHASLDYEGLSGAAHGHKLALAQALLKQCQALDCPLLVLDASRLPQSSRELSAIVADMRKLSLLAVPLGLKIAWRAHPGAAHARDFMTATDVVQAVERPNLGLALDVQEWLRADADLSPLEGIDPEAIFQVQLADALLAELPADGLSREQRLFPGEGQHGPDLQRLLSRLSQIGCSGHYAFADVAGDCALLPNALLVERAARAAAQLAQDVLRRGQPRTLQRRRATA